MIDAESSWKAPIAGGASSFVIAIGVLLHPGALFAGGPCSTGADGSLVVSAAVTHNLPVDGVFNYTTITINSGGILRFNRNAANTPVFLMATGPVVIDGSIQANGSNRIGGVGGGDGGLHGHGIQSGTNGTGPSPGIGGLAGNPRPGNAGGGGGMATAGTTAIRHTGPAPSPGGPAIALPSPLVGGSGGGGGGGWEFFTNLFDGGDGGGAGGAIVICSDMSININGSILANGANGLTAFANVGGHGGPGGGGSGGVVDLTAPTITLTASGVLQAIGGKGGGISTIPVFDPNFSSGANGGRGFVRITATSTTLSGTIEGTTLCGASCVTGACGDTNSDGAYDGEDVSGFVECLLTGVNCNCADFDCDGAVETPEILPFVNCLLG